MTEYIETRPEAIEAIHKSISHWNDICAGCESDYSASGCYLCLEYLEVPLSWLPESLFRCFGCPVKKSGNNCYNKKSTWAKYRNVASYHGYCEHSSANEAEAMLEALVMLLPESERVVYGG
jgi:hypothetical protein